MSQDEANGRAVEPLLMTKAEVAEFLNIAETAVQTLNRTHRLKGRRVGSRSLRWLRSDVLKFVAGLV